MKVKRALAPLPGTSSKIVDESLLKNCAITASLEKQPGISKASSKKEKSAGDAGAGWFNMPAGEVTPEVQKDLHLLKVRSALDPKHHYKKGTFVTPKYFQVGTVLGSSLDRASERLNKKERKRNLVENLMADAERTKYYKKKFLEIQKKKESGGKKSWNNRVNQRKPAHKRK